MTRSGHPALRLEHPFSDRVSDPMGSALAIFAFSEVRHIASRLILLAKSPETEKALPQRGKRNANEVIV
jgi:hypothetical protein